MGRPDRSRRHRDPPPARTPDPDPEPDDSAYILAVTFFSIVAAILLAVGTAALFITAFSVPAPTSRPRLFLAYAGGASAVAGAALATMTGLLVVARRCRTEELDLPSAYRGLSPEPEQQLNVQVDRLGSLGRFFESKA